MIYTTGDSHAEWTFNGIAGVMVHSISSITMHRVGRMEDPLIRNAVANMRLTADDVLILACGEIDCRCHINPQLHKRGAPLLQVVQELVDAYLNVAASLPTNGARLAILCVPPPVPAGQIYYGGELLPVFGTNAERVEYVRTMNHTLKRECSARGMVFVDVYDHYADGSGLLIPELSDGNVHIRQNDYVEQTLRNLGLLR